ncbi:MAG: class I tRNA ligase family protein, partial [Verrucomicrobiota bacterium]|nr:class I tRNA ligase family protein [Verrucomicrobiota bacterium]
PGRFLEVATTRPETIMADTALAVHPRDERYRALIGQHVWRPLAREKLRIIGDEAIDPEFGTGALKVTPAHDKVDFEIGQRHALPVIDVLHPNGRINCPAVPELDGLDRFEARKKAAEMLAEQGALAKEEPYENNVGFSERAGVPIEPRLSEQWFLRYPKTEEALAVVREHLIQFFPAHWEKVYAQWLENIQDWCISRQVWWGHRIPAWYRRMEDDIGGGISFDPDDIYVGIEPPPNASTDWLQDADTLDTWFSSWLWAYETMDAATRAKFYPTSVLVTAPDIIFFWVARMIIAGLQFKPGKSANDADNIPFRDVYFTGLIRDSKGRKMSKSLGNSPDPLELIAKYGADAVRAGVVGNAPIGHDIYFDEKNLELGRNFCTKLWNAARLRLFHGGPVNLPIDPSILTSIDRFILAALSKAVAGISKSFDQYEFAGAWLQLNGFFRHDFCDWYLEGSKAATSSDDQCWKRNAIAVIDEVLDTILRISHPLLPHITEELWHILEYSSRYGGAHLESISFAPWPKPFDEERQRMLGLADDGAADVRVIFGAVNAARTLRVEHGIPSNQRVVFILQPSQPIAPREHATLRVLLHAEALEINQHADVPKGTPTAHTGVGDLYLLIGETNREAERERLAKEIARCEEELRTVRAKLANESFVGRAPAAVVEEHLKREAAFAEQLLQLTRARDALD